MLRHSYCTQSADAGVPAFVLQEQMGYRHLATTQRYYHASRESRRQATSLLEQARGRPPPPRSEPKDNDTPPLRLDMPVGADSTVRKDLSTTGGPTGVLTVVYGPSTSDAIGIGRRLPNSGRRPARSRKWQPRKRLPGRFKDTQSPCLDFTIDLWCGPSVALWSTVDGERLSATVACSSFPSLPGSSPAAA